MNYSREEGSGAPEGLEINSAGREKLEPGYSHGFQAQSFSQDKSGVIALNLALS